MLWLFLAAYFGIGIYHARAVKHLKAAITPGIRLLFMVSILFLWAPIWIGAGVDGGLKKLFKKPGPEKLEPPTKKKRMR